MPLHRATIALVTTAGVHMKDQLPFDMQNSQGDATFRLLPGDVAPQDLTITHDYYDHAAADRDVNTVFPIVRLRELIAHGLVGGTASFHVGAMGHILGEMERRLVTESAPAIAQEIRRAGADYAIISPG